MRGTTDRGHESDGNSPRRIRKHTVPTPPAPEEALNVIAATTYPAGQEDQPKDGEPTAAEEACNWQRDSISGPDS